MSRDYLILVRDLLLCVWCSFIDAGRGGHGGTLFELTQSSPSTGNYALPNEAATVTSIKPAATERKNLHSLLAMKHQN